MVYMWYAELVKMAVQTQEVLVLCHLIQLSFQMIYFCTYAAAVDWLFCRLFLSAEPAHLGKVQSGRGPL